MALAKRQLRLDDFERRVAHSPERVVSHPRYTDWRYIAIHPFSDEVETLARLSVNSADCRSVDAWCILNGDATLLECSVVGVHPSREAGFFARNSGDDLEWTYLQMVVDAESISRTLFENAMIQFVKLGFPDELPEIPANGSAIRIG